MNWKTKIAEVSEYGDIMLKVIVKSQNNEVVVCVESLDDKFVEQFVRAHNTSVSESYEKGLRDGIQIERENKYVDFKCGFCEGDDFEATIKAHGWKSKDGDFKEFLVGQQDDCVVIQDKNGLDISFEMNYCPVCGQDIGWS